MTAIDEIKDRIDLVDLVSETVNLRRSGKNYMGFCPFHENTRTPAFVVFPDTNTWRCFGCNEGGDVFRFVMKKEGWDFKQTIQYLAEKAGIELEPPSSEDKEREDEFERFRILLDESVIFYQHHLLQNPAGRRALEYFQRRGLSNETIQVFSLGYAPELWDACLNHFTGKGYTQEDLLAVGLVTERQNEQGVYDRFRNRLLYPIYDGMGRMTGYGARTLDPDGIPKYLNSPQTGLFDKGRTLYGLHLARKAIRAKDQVVIVEGYMDVIGLYQAGFHNTVSPMGTALTEDQLRQLKRLTRRIVLALDPDAAGERATMRGLEVARQTLDRTDEMVFDARGLLRHEARLQADLRVTTLPAGRDPDEIVLENPQEWERILEAAKPIVIHVMDTLAANQDIDDPKVKSSIASQVLPLIEDVPDSVERESYRQRLARLIRVDERSLIGAHITRTQKRKMTNAPQRQEQTTVVLPVDSTPKRIVHTEEAMILGCLMYDPDMLNTVDRGLQNIGLNRFAQQDFEATDHQMFYRMLAQSIDQDDQEPLGFIYSNINEPLVEVLNHLDIPKEDDVKNQTDLIFRIIKAVIRLRQIRIHENLKRIQYIQKDLQEPGMMNPGAYQEMIMQLTLDKMQLDKAARDPIRLD